MPLAVSSHPDVELPDERCRLWRYMDFTMFVAMLDSQGLYFRRADKFDDHWEGVIPRELLDWIEAHAPKPSWMNGTTFAQHFRNVEIPRHFVSCWHLSEVESAAMWSIYGAGNKSIAIQSTVGRFCQSLANGVLIGNPSEYVPVKFGQVRYGDHHAWHFGESCTGDVYAIPFFFKRQSYLTNRNSGRL